MKLFWEKTADQKQIKLRDSIEEKAKIAGIPPSVMEAKMVASGEVHYLWDVLSEQNIKLIEK